MWRRPVALPLVVPLMVAASCGSPRSSSSSGNEEAEDLATSHQAFDSHESVLVDFDIDGSLVARTEDPSTVRTLIEAQLMYAVGALNAERAVGRYGRLELSAITATAAKPALAPNDVPTFTIRYHAKLPVAWWGSSAIPSTYSLTLPARVEQADQQAFADKYGKSCVDPAVGEFPAGALFLHYRPNVVGCAFDPSDVAVASATISPSTENTQGKYPEYQRVWEDGSLDAMVLFSRAYKESESVANDEGVRSFETFLAQTDAYLRAQQPDPLKRSAESQLPPFATRTATLPDGRTIHVHVALVGTELAHEGPAFDAWYESRTPHADVIMYSGHAGLGANIRALMDKGVFVQGKYLVWMVNGCDTFAYVDRRLADRRALLNPDDPGGTKYMDTISNVMPGYFTTGAASSWAVLEAFIVARNAQPAPKTYREIFAAIDPEEGIVVTGEEDNVFAPSMFSPIPEGYEATANRVPSIDLPRNELQPDTSRHSGSGRCAFGVVPQRGDVAASTAAFACVLAALARSRRRHLIRTMLGS